MDIKERVNQIVRKYGTRNPLEIVKAMDIILVRHPLEGVRGFYHYFQRNHIIYVDERLPENELLFVIAHELGHLFLHKDSNAILMDGDSLNADETYTSDLIRLPHLHLFDNLS